MRELSSSAFPLGETSLHLLHTPDGNMFVTADLAVKLFDSAPATFAEFVRANRYVRVNAMERAVVRLCASLEDPSPRPRGTSPCPSRRLPSRGMSVRKTRTRRRIRERRDAAGPKDAVTLLPEKTVLAILRGSARAAPRRAVPPRPPRAARSSRPSDLADRARLPTRCPSRSTPCAGRRTYTRPRARGGMAAERDEREAARAASGSPSDARGCREKPP